MSIQLPRFDAVVSSWEYSPADSKRSNNVVALLKAFHGCTNFMYFPNPLVSADIPWLHVDFGVATVSVKLA